MTGRQLKVGGAVAAVALAGAALYLLVLRPGDAPRGERSGRALAAAVAAVTTAEPAPHPCARLPLAGGGTGELTAGGRSWRRDGATLRADGGDDRLVIGLVADARGDHPETRRNLERVAAAFADAGVELVLVLGGMAAGGDELTELVRPLAAGDGWPVVLLPGDREAVAAVDATVGALGERAVSGVEIRYIEADGAVVGTLPGVAEPAQLVAGADGCAFEPTDAAAVVRELEARPGHRVLAAYEAPRGGLGVAADQSADGIHTGSRALTAAIGGAELALVVHAGVDQAAYRPPSGSRPHPPRRQLAAGAIDATPLAPPTADRPALTGAALIVQVGSKKVEWRRLRFQGDELVE